MSTKFSHRNKKNINTFLVEKKKGFIWSSEPYLDLQRQKIMLINTKETIPTLTPKQILCV